MSSKSITPPQAFLTFAGLMIQDAEFFDTLDDLLRSGLQGIPHGQLGDFIAFVKRIEAGDPGDRELHALWLRSGADFGGTGKAIRILLSRARTLAEEEGPDGSLYRKELKWNSEPKPIILP